MAFGFRESIRQRHEANLTADEEQEISDRLHSLGYAE